MNKEAYISEFKRLVKEMRGTDPIYSKGSPAYQRLSNSLDGYVSQLEGATDGNFDAIFTQVMKSFAAKASQYRSSHRKNALDDRQMKRLKIMNRFAMLKEVHDNMPDVDPRENYTLKLAEKVVHASCLVALNGKDADEKAKAEKILFSPAVVAKMALKLSQNENFLNQIPKSEEEIKKLVTTNGIKVKKQIGKLSLVSESDSKEGKVTFDDLLSNEEMNSLRKDMISIGSGTLNYNNPVAKIANSGDVAQMEQYLRENPKMKKAEKEYLQRMLASAKFYNKLSETGMDIDPETNDPVQKEDGTIILEDIAQDEFQNTFNGCYSCAYQLLLQSRGLNLTQEQIRNFRQDEFNNRADLAEKERVSGDKMGNIIQLGGIVTRCLKNTAMQERTYRNVSKQDEGTKRRSINSIVDDISKAIEVHKSPAALLLGNHYVTVVGINKEKGTLIYKDSLRTHSTGGGPNANHEMPFSHLGKYNRITVTNLISINPDDPTKGMEKLKDIEYVNNHYQAPEKHQMGDVSVDYNKDGSSIINTEKLNPKVKMSDEDAGTLQTVIQVPKKLILQKGTEKAHKEKFMVKPLKNSPEKQRLMEDIEKMERELFPDPEKEIQVIGEEDKYKMIRNYEIKYGDEVIPVQRVNKLIFLKNIKDNIDVLSPVQVKKHIET